ncbi:PDT-domain-containing protein [Rhizodiscina lignyota]|uniref:prephenate dehydratase n=1 Tax=Rhizodiscina lignyota TaxID=1504668 RepID=A0A9P4IPA6_9PEZI|nr:PDT-domain-containing protein [Rhizodiscina lignyota]
MNCEEPIVAYLGPKSSWTSQAAEKCFPDVVEAVQSGKVDRGVIPFENSSNGTVITTLDTLSTSHLECSDLTIAGETTLKISHCLLVRSIEHGQITPPDSPAGAGTPADHTDQGSRSLDGSAFAELKRIKHVYSHPQALGQCREFLAANLPWAELHQTSSTAEAAIIASKDHTNSSAAVGSVLAARQIGLRVLLEGVQDVRENSTRFLVLKRDPADAPPWHSSRTHPEGEQRKLLVSFAIDQRAQGKLAHALSTFNKPSIQLTNIHSRPSRKSPFHYVYFVEIQWRAEKDGGQQLQDALRDLGKISQSRRCHGTWGPTLEW